MDDESVGAHDRLRVIAGVLGVTTDRFYEPAFAPRPENTTELNYLWHRLRTPEGRAAALDALNRILDEERR